MIGQTEYRDGDKSRSARKHRMTPAAGNKWRIAAVHVVALGAAICCKKPCIAQVAANSKSNPGKASASADAARNAELIAPARPAIEKGLKFLSSRQKEDGAFGASGYGRNAAVVALAGMSWLASGSTPGRGPYGAEVNRVTNYLLDHCGQSGFISVEGAMSRGPMYEHGFATLFLAEVYGMSPRNDLREKLARAVDLIVRTQNEEGGWRYQPRRSDADISVTICQVMALRAARNAGLKVPRETVDRCVDYVKRCQNADGGFRYQREGPVSSEFPRSAAGVVALYSAGIYEGREVERGLAYLDQFLPRAGGATQIQDGHFFYGQYYAAQAMWQADRERWLRWYPAVRDLLVSRQEADGSWADPVCFEYGTAMATIILQMPDNSVPIFQR
jgi:hypothetical protein